MYMLVVAALLGRYAVADASNRFDEAVVSGRLQKPP